MRLLYNLAIFLYLLVIRMAGPFHSKAGLWLKGRKGWKARCSAWLNENKGKPLVWFHAASLGEFEQGRPVIEEIRKKYPSLNILLTFFSPSGLEVRKKYPHADYIEYLPIDTPRNARWFVSHFKPSLAVFVKYEFWFNFILELHHTAVPTVLISAVFRPGQYFFKWYGTWFRKMLGYYKMIFIQDEDSGSLLKKAGHSRVLLGGDTRFDRVMEIASTAAAFPGVKAFCGEMPVIVAGSTWPEDEALLSAWLAGKTDQVRLVITPHEVNEGRIIRLLKHFKSFRVISISDLDEEAPPEGDVLLIDRIGVLAQLYQYARIAYIGGGFGRGIHNILEATAFGKPVLFGPRYMKFREATDLVRLQGAFPVRNHQEIATVSDRLLSDKEWYCRCEKVCLKYMQAKRGATRRIIEYLDTILPVT
ncbi:MAG: 3-deoxy-D-manno-octulosonic acid transferase [Bacteroidales bacterium]|nr:3-deoxy-D-manno-octulosonic acid transferase [Bacteroidales bacterium]